MITISPLERDPRRFAEALSQLTRKADETITLTASATTTTIADAGFRKDDIPFLIPTTGNAAAALATTYVSSRSRGSFVLTHANNAQVDRTFLVRWGS